MEINPTVFIVDDDEGVRQGLLMFCKSIGLQAEAYHSAFHFLSEYNPINPGCLLLDIRMPELDGIELQKKLLERQIQLPVIIISGHANVPTAVEAMKLGAIDLITKPFRNEAIIPIIESAIKTDLQQRQKKTNHALIQDYFETLSNREREVLSLIYSGLSNKEMAHELRINRKTIEFHRKKIMVKMHAESLAELVRLTGPFLKRQN
jgi:RNA polymerase sigma factor (sigma-70 family)